MCFHLCLLYKGCCSKAEVDPPWITKPRRGERVGVRLVLWAEGMKAVQKTIVPKQVAPECFQP